MAAAEPLLAPTPPPQLHDFPIIYPQRRVEEDSEDDEYSPSPPRRKILRCKTAPAMAVMKYSRSHQTDPKTLDLQSDSSSLVRQAALLLLIYLSVGVVTYSFNRQHFSGVETHPVADGLYFCIVTMCTIGYGDIAPSTPPAKVFACVFVLVGFGFIDVLLSGAVNHVLDLQEKMILKARLNYMVDVAKGRMRIRLKVSLALGVVVVCIGVGGLILYFVEDLDWVDSIYLSVMSVTTVGYGDRAFKTVEGRLLASVWLLFSTLGVGRAFLYLAEARIDKRHRKIVNWALHRDITVDDLLAAGINNNNNGFISKSEYVIYKLKEMGKIREKDIRQSRREHERQLAYEEEQQLLSFQAAVASQSKVVHELKETPSVPKNQDKNSVVGKKNPPSRPVGMVIRVKPQSKKAKVESAEEPVETIKLVDSGDAACSVAIGGLVSYSDESEDDE